MYVIRKFLLVWIIAHEKVTSYYLWWGSKEKHFCLSLPKWCVMRKKLSWVDEPIVFTGSSCISSLERMLRESNVSWALRWLCCFIAWKVQTIWRDWCWKDVPWWLSSRSFRWRGKKESGECEGEELDLLWGRARFWHHYDLFLLWNLGTDCFFFFLFLAILSDWMQQFVGFRIINMSVSVCCSWLIR